MASVTTESVPSGPRQDISAQRGTTERGRNRGRGRGRGGSSSAPGGESRSSDGSGSRRSRGGRGGGRGRGARLQTPSVPSMNGLSLGGDDAAKPAGPVVIPDADDAASDTDSAVCFICADPVIYSSIAPCNHVTCHICALRMRALYKTKACAHCRTEAEFVIFSKHDKKRFDEFKEEDIVSVNELLGIKFDDHTTCDDTTLLLRYNCPEPNCDTACRGWPDLHRHVKSIHGQVLCDLCSRNKKVFTHEHTLFNPQELRKHERTGDDQPGSENQSGFQGHPECGFCRQRFYSSDELYTHCRDRHERCHICDRRNIHAPQQYFINYEALAGHFQKDHFICTDEECLEKKFVVFESGIDLKAHQLEVHPDGLSKTAKRDARRIDMSNFEGRFQNQRDGGRRRGQQMPEEPLPRTEQQMSRAELAYHRTMAVQSAQSTTSRNFGGQLSDPPLAARTPPPNAVRPSRNVVNVTTPLAGGPVTTPVPVTNPVTVPVAFPPLAPLAPRTPNPSQAEPPRVAITEETRRWRHAAVVDRALDLLKNDTKKLENFKASVGGYRTGALSASDLVDAFWVLFDTKASDLGKLIKELAELYEDEHKKQDLLKAWNSWKAINEDYPPFAGAASSSSSAPISAANNSSTSRVLKIKSSTSHSARSTTARQTAWGTASSDSLSISSQPSQAPQKSANRIGAGSHAPTPWVTPAVASSATTPLSSASSSKTRLPADAFPSLPAKTPPPAGWGPIKKKPDSWTPQAQGNAWSGNTPEQDQGSAESEVEGVVPNGRKKKGKQKQVLFHVG